MLYNFSKAFVTLLQRPPTCFSIFHILYCWEKFWSDVCMFKLGRNYDYIFLCEKCPGEWTTSNSELVLIWVSGHQTMARSLDFLFMLCGPYPRAWKYNYFLLTEENKSTWVLWQHYYLHFKYFQVLLLNPTRTGTANILYTTLQRPNNKICIIRNSTFIYLWKINSPDCRETMKINL